MTIADQGFVTKDPQSELQSSRVQSSGLGQNSQMICNLSYF